jgi:vanillate/3-O-methylgallate O-demethylase
MSLQENIDQAGSPLALLTAGSVDVSNVFPYPPEYTNWRDEQRAWAQTAVLLNQSFHMSDLFISGPDVRRLLSDTSVNSYRNFRAGAAKQYIAVNHEGYLVGDSILVALSDDEVTVAGFEHSLNWLQYHGESGGYDVTFSRDSASTGEPGSKRLYRYELEGPHAWQIAEEAAGAPLDRIQFFHIGKFTIAGRTVTALNHTMGGVPGQADTGLELFGPAEDTDEVIGAILSAGEKLGLVHGGAKAYLSTIAESGWMGGVVPAVYTSESLRAYREWLPGTALENFGLAISTGSFHPETVQGYYTTPWDLGYGHVIKFDHEFIGRQALQQLAENPPRQKVWLVWSQDDTERIVLNSELDKPNAPKLLPFPATVSRDQVLIGDRLAGVTQYHGYTVNIGGWVSVASLDTAEAVDGTEVEILWGDADGGTGNPLVPSHVQTRIRATVSLHSPKG